MRLDSDTVILYSGRSPETKMTTMFLSSNVIECGFWAYLQNQKYPNNLERLTDGTSKALDGTGMGWATNVLFGLSLSLHSWEVYKRIAENLSALT